mmetsp:Transcript_77107/g.160513  ORF Transcript_77107/g.160513 Transcript_77107/m.160513 type:complete len:150 (+) Transcript_77107:237-686(+)
MGRHHRDKKCFFGLCSRNGCCAEFCNTCCPCCPCAESHGEREQEKIAAREARLDEAKRQQAMQAHNAQYGGQQQVPGQMVMVAPPVVMMQQQQVSAVTYGSPEGTYGQGGGGMQTMGGGGGGFEQQTQPAPPPAKMGYEMPAAPPRATE